jgi:DNA-binding response OmpR family regulator
MGQTVNLPEPPRTEGTVVVLSVSPLEETHSRLRGILEHTNWSLMETRACQEAVEILRGQGLAVVICERDMPDGSWADLLQMASALPSPPLIIVTSRDADERLWGEVLNLGGYDVLAKPLEASEVTRVISLAWMHWRQKWSGLRKPAGGGLARGASLRAALA